MSEMGKVVSIKGNRRELNEAISEAILDYLDGPYREPLGIGGVPVEHLGIVANRIADWIKAVVLEYPELIEVRIIPRCQLIVIAKVGRAH